MDDEKSGNNLPFQKVDENTVFLVTNTANGLLSSYIHLCPQKIWEASKSYYADKAEEKQSHNTWFFKK